MRTQKNRDRIHELLLKAISEKKLVKFSFRSKIRIAEPHDYGVQKGKIRLFCYQIRGQSSEPLPGWRWIEVPELSDLEILSETFAGSRSEESSRHHTWEKVFARVR
jgi:hypothetical protein